MVQHLAGCDQQKGFSLIEVIIAMLVLGIGASGLGLLLLASVQGTVQAQERSQATFQASELAQLIHANPSAFGHLTHRDYDPAQCAGLQACPDESWAAEHLLQWQEELQLALSQARGIVCKDSSPLDGNLSELACDGLGDAVVKIVWQEPVKQRQQSQDRQLALPLPRP